MPLSSEVRLRPEIMDMMKSGASKVASAGAGAMKKVVDGEGFSILWMLLIFAITIGAFMWYSKQRAELEYPANIARKAREGVAGATRYAELNTKRIGLRQYLQEIQKSGVPANHMALTNFYVSTVNATGFFFPANNGVFTPEAARIAVLAGARAFVFDIHPDLTPGAGFAPCLQVVEAGSRWRRISINSLPFILVLRALVEEKFNIPQRPGAEDPMYLYFRFRGTPRRQTYEGVTNAIRTLLEPYRLPNVFNACRKQTDIYTEPITSFYRKVIIMSNQRATGTTFADYVNIGPDAGIKLEYNPYDAKGLTKDMQAEAINKVKGNLTFIAPAIEDPEAEANKYDFKDSHDIGIHCVAYNIWNNNDMLKKYQKVFERSSFIIKPTPLRHFIDVIAPPKNPKDFGWGSGPTAGEPRMPPALQMPV